MRSFLWQVLTAGLLATPISLATCQAPPPGGVDSLASGNHWAPSPHAQPGIPPSPQGQPGIPPSPQGQPGIPPSPQGQPGIPLSPNAQPGIPPAAGQGNPPVGSAFNPRDGWGGFQPESDFSSTPTKALMYTYVPKSFKKGNPVVVGVHHCAGTGPGYFREYPDWPKAAEEKGFMMIFPSSPGETGACWDVSSAASLKHNGGGDSQTIVNMVKYAQTKYGASDKKVFVVGHSSGAMMTEVLAAAYPDVFVAGAEYSGVPAGCFKTNKQAGADWNSACAGGNVRESPEYWGQQAKDMYPEYKGSYPRMMLVHGKADQTINYENQVEAVKQWTYLHHLDANKPTKQYDDAQKPNYHVSEYGHDVLAISADGVTHDNPARVDLTVQFFGL